MLNEDRQWDDRGTGHVSSAYVERLRGMSLLVRSETDGSILLESKIQPDTAYQKQQETLIVWSEADNYDLALSFQEKAGCDEIWEKICQVQGRDPSVEITQDVVDESEDERYDEIPDAAPPIELPPCELSKLEEIAELFSSVLPSPIRREKLAVAIENDSYIKKLVDLFHMCEDLENMEGLHHLFDIFKSVFLLNKNALFEIMFSDDVIFDIVGVLEYDPSLPQPAKHRDYLRNKAKFKEVVPMTNCELENKIHQTYRVQYIQEVILPTPSVFEENMLSSLSSFVFFNKVEIVSMIQEDVKFLTTLFAQLMDDETSDEHRRDLVMFLKEFCTFSQTLQQPSRENFFKTLSSLGILSTIEIILGQDDQVMKSAAIDIFSYIVEFSPSMVREFVVQEMQNRNSNDVLINLVIEEMINDADPELGGAMQLIGILRLLLDPENMLASANKTEKTEFLSFFYRSSITVLTAPLFAITANDKPSRDDYKTAQLLGLILELLSFCAEHHTYNIKNFIVSKDLLGRVLVLLGSRHSFLVLCALRFMRKIVGLKEEFYNRYIIRYNLFKPIVNLFLRNGDRYNLLNSALIELFEFIRVEDIKTLSMHVVENFQKELEGIKYVKTFETLKLRYDQQQDRLRDRMNLEGHTGPLVRNSRFRRDVRSLEEDEDLHFDQDEDTEDMEGPPIVADFFKHKLESDLDKIWGHKPGKEQGDLRDVSQRLLHKASPLNLNLKAGSNTPLSNLLGTPPNPGSPGSPNSPGSPGPSPHPTADKTSDVTKKPGLRGLVDYPDEDSEEEGEEEEEEVIGPSPKRPRLGT